MSQEKSHERLNQKRRTRAELLRAAREIMDSGALPTVGDVADHAGISRATAYRYFSTPEELMRETALDTIAKGIDIELPASLATLSSPQERARQVVKQVYKMVEDNEPTFRALLASSVSGKNKVRRGARRLDWLSTALQPLEGEIPPKELQNLKYALSLVTGIETLVVFKDICGLNAKQAEDAALWTAKTLLEGVLAERT
jgi:AcrR family transcriptional regulator